MLSIFGVSIVLYFIKILSGSRNLGILAKPNFKVYESKYAMIHHPLRAQSLRFKLLEGQP
jgi:hypothetical protein